MPVQLILARSNKLKLSRVKVDVLQAANMGLARSKEFLMGRWLIRAKLADYFLCSMDEIVIEKYGRKYRIVAPNSMEISLSHTSGWFAFAFSKESVGVDLELAAREIDILKIARRYFNSIEIKWLLSLDDPKSNALMHWVKKEAYTKYLGSTIARQLGLMIDNRVNIDFRTLFGCYLACVSNELEVDLDLLI